MIIQSKKGNFILKSNYRDAFNLETFESKYIEECFERYSYIVGDISSGILRLKGFDTNPKSKNYFGFIDDYLELSCAMGCQYYILKKIQNDKEYQQELNNPSEVKAEGFVINNLIKESFDKETLVLESTPKIEPKILIDSQKINAIPKGELTSDIKDIIKQEKNNSNLSKTEISQSYVSSSPDFVPNQNNRAHRNKKNNKK